MLPKPFKQFPNDFAQEKLLVLIEECKITFSEKAFSYLEGYADLQVAFVAKNIDRFFEIKDQISIDDDFREELLDTSISDDQRLKIVADMNLDAISGLPSRASVIGKLYHRTQADLSHLTEGAAKAMIENINPVENQVAFLNRSKKILTDDTVRQVLSEMPHPFPDFKPGFARPKIPKTDANVELVDWLVDRGIISSWKDWYFGDIQIHNFRN